MLTLNKFHIFFYCFFCSLSTTKMLTGLFLQGKSFFSFKRFQANATLSKTNSVLKNYLQIFKSYENSSIINLISFSLAPNYSKLNLRIQSKYGKIRSRKTSYFHTFHAVMIINIPPKHNLCFQPLQLTVHHEQITRYHDLTNHLCQL